MIVYADGCDHYDQNSTIDLKWTVNDGCVSTPNGRNGRGITIGSGFIGKTLVYNASWAVGFAAIFQTTQGWGGEAQLYSLYHAGDTRLAWISIEGDATITLHAGNTNIIANSGQGANPFSLHPQTWYYIEVMTVLTTIVNGQTMLTDVAVTMTVNVNGVQVATGGPVDSLITVSSLLLNIAQANFHRIDAGGVVDGTTTVDDMYFCNINGQGSINGFAGDIKLGALYPMADVQHDWTSVPGLPAYQCVNQQYPDGGDTTYIASYQGGQQDIFDFQPISPFYGTIPFVHYGVFARKDNEGTRAFQLTCNGKNVGPVIFPGDTYVYYFYCMDENPQTNQPWGQEDFDGSTFGVNLIS